MPEFDEGLPLEWRGESGRTAVVTTRLEHIGQRALSSMRAQSHVEMKDAFLFCFDPLKQLLSESFKVFRVLQFRLAVRAAFPSIDEQDLNVRRIAEFPAAELAQAQHRKRAWFPVLEQGAAIMPAQLCLAIDDATGHDDLGELREGQGEIGQASRSFDDMFHVDPEQLMVFKPIQGILSRFVCFGASDQTVELFP